MTHVMLGDGQHSSVLGVSKLKLRGEMTPRRPHSRGVMELEGKARLVGVSC